MNKTQKEEFNKKERVYESALLKFTGVEGFDVYNPSIPFVAAGKEYIYGRVEKRNEWARSWVRLFEKAGVDEWKLVENSMIYQLEDPYVSVINNELVMGGTHVMYSKFEHQTYFGYFYKGNDLNDMFYFTTGPDKMKDIRLVEMADKKIGVFSRPRGDEIIEKYGSESVVGFTIINDLTELDAKVVETAPVIDGLFNNLEWGGCNQCYLLDSGNIGVIGHKCYSEPASDGEILQVYYNVAFVIEPQTRKVLGGEVIGTRDCYPESEAKMPRLRDCVFTSGIVERPDGKVDLYSGVCDVSAGRITIDNPFEGYGKIVTTNSIC